MRDRYGRALRGVRLSVTLRCNYKCLFCHLEGIEFNRSRKELKPEHFEMLAKAFSRLGASEFKITGGEPLVRADIVEIVESISPYSSDTSMTTNGALLHKYASKLASAGLNRINVSMPSLREERYKALTGGRLDVVLEGLREASSNGIKVKLNFLVLRQNSDELNEIIGYASRHGYDVNVIELIPTATHRSKESKDDSWQELYQSIDPIEKMLDEIATRKFLRELHNRPVYVLPSGIKVNIVRGFDNPLMCMGCIRLRVTPDGKVKSCIFQPRPSTDLLPLLEEGDIDGIVQALRSVWLGREFSYAGARDKSSHMHTEGK